MEKAVTEILCQAMKVTECDFKSTHASFRLIYHGCLAPRHSITLLFGSCQLRWIMRRAGKHPWQIKY